jgi:probable HAF family extracellular repeat protein
MIDLGSLGADVAFAWGVNNLGQIVGSSAFERGGNGRGFLWEDGAMIDLGTIPGGHSSVALDINDLQQIVGYADNGGPDVEPMFWEDGVMRSIQNFELGDSGYANRINNLGQIVGFTQFEATAKPRAFIWDETNGMRLIEDLIPPNHGLKINIGRDINDHGQIALEAARGNPFINGEFVGMLVTPVHPTMALEAPSPGAAGVENTLTLTGATPGATVRFLYSRRGGGEIIPGCATRLNALQLANPTFIGMATADENGSASITAMVPSFAGGRTILFQAVVIGDCAISELMQHEFE